MAARVAMSVSERFPSIASDLQSSVRPCSTLRAVCSWRFMVAGLTLRPVWLRMIAALSSAVRTPFSSGFSARIRSTWMPSACVALARSMTLRSRVK